MDQRNDNLGRRHFYRMKVTYLVCFRAKFSETAFSHYQYSLTKDISVGGLMVMSEEAFPEKTEIEMIIQLPMFHDKKIHAKGIIADSIKAKTEHAVYPLRIKFTEFDEQAFEELKKYIDSEMEKETDGKTLREKMDRRGEE